MISKEIIQRIEDATDMVALVSEFVTLEKAGKNFKGICPFHNDSNPSFSVSEEKKIAKCMVCGEGGRPIKFLSKIKNISFLESAKELSQRVNIKLDINIKAKNTEDYSNYYQIMQKAQQLYTRNLLSTESGKVALNYLYERGLDDEIIKVFSIGLSPNNPTVLYNVLKENDIFDIDMLDLGLVNKSGNNFYDAFTKRIMFAIKDENHNIVAFSGRTYLESTGKNEAKYVNSKETPIFIKGDCLYNLNNASIDIRRKNQVVLYEGFLDVIASYKANIKEAVCSMGTALTLNQAKLLKKYTSNVVICYDSDKAGVSASFKAIDVLKQAGLNVKLVLLPDMMDPDDYIKNYSKEEFFEYFNENIIDPLEYEYKIITKDLDNKDILKTNEIKDKVFSMISKTNSLSIIESYLKKLSNDINISFESLETDYSNNFNISKMPKVVEIKEEHLVFENPHIPFDDDYIPHEPYIPDMDYIPFAEEDVPHVDDIFAFLDNPLAPKTSKTHNFSNKEDIFLNILSTDVKCMLRLIRYAQESKQQALKIDNEVSLYSVSLSYKRIWETLIDKYYEKYETYNSDTFYKLLSDEDKSILIIDLNKENTLDKVNYTQDDLEYCLKQLKCLGIQKDIDDYDDKINKCKNLEEKQELIKLKTDLIKQLIALQKRVIPKRK